jgi:dienelactone hydrolase
LNHRLHSASRLLACTCVLALAGLFVAVSFPAGAQPASNPKLLSAFRKEFKRPAVALAPQVTSGREGNGVRFEKITISSENGVRVPILLATPTASAITRHPVVICLHGLGGNKEGFTGDLQDYARRGFVACALDARYHGERSGDLSKAMAEAFRTGKEHPYLWDTAWDTWKTIDYLETRPDVDKKRIGVMGISLGGHTAWMVSADPRIKVLVPCISVCSWRWQLANGGYKQRVGNLQGAFDAVRDAMGEKQVSPAVVAAAWDKWMPGVPAKYDCQDILAARAPLPLLVIGGDEDPIAPIEGAKLAFEVIGKAYQQRHASEAFQTMIAEHSGHAVTAEHQRAIVAWFTRWLEPGK